MTTYHDDDREDTDEGLGNVASFKILEGSLEPGDYDAYVGLLDRATLQRLNSPDDFFAEAKFPTEEYGDVVLGYYELGMEQMYARCNNRESELRYLREILKYIDECEKQGAPYESPTVDILMVAELELLHRRGKWKKGLKRLRKRYNKQLRELMEGIAIDKELGVYRDYSSVRKKWQVAMKNKESVMGAAVGDIVQDMPEFFKIAVSMARRTESDTRRRHVQALLARVLENVGDIFGFRAAQNSLGGGNTGRKRRRFLGGGGDSDRDAA